MSKLPGRYGEDGADDDDLPSNVHPVASSFGGDNNRQSKSGVADNNINDGTGHEGRKDGRKETQSGKNTMKSSCSSGRPAVISDENRVSNASRSSTKPSTGSMARPGRQISSNEIRSSTLTSRSRRNRGHAQVDEDGDYASVSSESEDEDNVPGAVRVSGRSDMAQASETIQDEESQAPSRRDDPTVAVVAELVPENDEMQEENERLRQQLKREREARNRQREGVVVAGLAERVDENKPTTRWLYYGLAFAALIAVVTGVTIALTVGQSDPIAEILTSPPSGSMSPSSSPSIEPTERASISPTRQPTMTPSEIPTIKPRFVRFLETFMAQEPTLELDVFLNTSSPQYHALHWLADVDALALEPTMGNRLALERFAMATLFFATEGDSWRNQLKFLQGQSICNWNNGDRWSFKGVYCNVQGRVFKLLMGDNLIHGQLPTELLWSLTDLREISFGWEDDSSTLRNALSVALPDIVDFLKDFTRIDFSGNPVYGTIPTTIGQLSQVTSLDLYESELSGTIPSEIGRLTQLTELSLGDSSRLTGTIPPELGALTNLEHLSLNTANLRGTVPSTLGALTKLTFLSLRENNDLRGNLEFLCTADFDWDVFTSDCITSTDDDAYGGYRTVCSCCTECYC